MQVHELNLHNKPFRAIKSGLKTIEMRLNDERRQCLKPGDQIEFTNRVTNEKLRVEIIKIIHYSSFDELYKHHKKSELGYKWYQKAKPSDMSQYYSKENMEKYGALAIKIRRV